jgi:hypothetical protein
MISVKILTVEVADITTCFLNFQLSKLYSFLFFSIKLPEHLISFIINPFSHRNRRS